MKGSRSVLALGCLFFATVLAFTAQARPQSASRIAEKPPRKVAILIFEHVQIIDYTGPYEAFGHVYSADQPVPFETYTVAEKSEPITTAMGMRVIPKYSIENAPKPDILVVPGGGVDSVLDSPAVIHWIQENAKDAQIVMSVCNGAFILAKAGLLDGLEATTTAFLIERLKQAAPKTKVVSDKRFVDNGKIITTAGLSSGIDGTLHIIERLYGRGTAEMAALGMEYNWDPESRYVRAALADKYLPNQYDVEAVVSSWVPASRRGNTEHWESSWTVGSEASPEDILKRMEPSFSNSNFFPRAPRIHWVRQGGENSKDQARSSWTFTDEAGRLWSGEVRIDAIGGQRNSYLVSVRVDRRNQDVGAVKRN
jgi:putative intracellular protease/amidase